MLFDNTKYQIWFIIGFAISNIILITTLHWIADDIQTGHSQIPVFNVGDVITGILGTYLAITLLMLVYDVLGKRPNMDRKNLFSYGLKSVLILGIVFYDGVVLLDAMPTFFQDMSNTENEFLWLKGIVLSSITLFIGLLFTKKQFELKVNYKIMNRS